MPNYIAHSSAALLFMLLLATGCKKAPIESGKLENAQESYDAALESFEAKSWSSAAQSLTSAIDAGGLSPDQYAEALVMRAECYLNEKKFDEAIADLEKAEQGYGDLARLYELKAQVFDAKGDSASAQKARQAAQQAGG